MDEVHASSARCSCNFGPLAGLAISVFREVRKNTVFTQNPHFSKAQALKMVHEKYWRLSLFVQELYYPQGSLNSCSPEFNWSPRSKSWSSLLFGFGFLVGLVNGSHRSCISTCSLAKFRDRNLSHTGLPMEVDELEEHLGWSFSLKVPCMWKRASLPKSSRLFVVGSKDGSFPFSNRNFTYCRWRRWGWRRWRMTLLFQRCP